MKIIPVAYDHPDAVALAEQVQEEYRRRFGYDDATPLHPSYFEPPSGLYLLAYDMDTAVASGGWRAQDSREEGYAPGDAEVKRMFVAPEARGRGLARRILAALEESARSAGRIRMVLETGHLLGEATSLYRSSGYGPTAGFGRYRGNADSTFFEKPL
ncbi:GNAT family N-acetyltransferase [Streptomyces paludis]|uniref:GNAT family N-acetyltransferase n=1 Tax=Streptomyces paludis TaxID=2282738 RepID=A0A345I2C6_9ACTN|nr:GNAT family N-acetyltransferase [Streptomyces paludis]AXG83100.1 GNAT family N-acetyltransferase [Streptomyces paludis]